MLTAQDILNKQDYKSENIEVEDWGGSVRIRSLSAKGLNDLIMDDEDESTVIKTVKTIVAGCIDEHGNKLFTKDDVEQLSDKSPESINHVSSKILELTGLNNNKKKK